MFVDNGQQLQPLSPKAFPFSPGAMKGGFAFWPAIQPFPGQAQAVPAANNNANAEASKDSSNEGTKDAADDKQDGQQLPPFFQYGAFNGPMFTLTLPDLPQQMMMQDPFAFAAPLSPTLPQVPSQSQETSNTNGNSGNSGTIKLKPVVNQKSSTNDQQSLQSFPNLNLPFLGKQRLSINDDLFQPTLLPPPNRAEQSSIESLALTELHQTSGRRGRLSQ